MGSGPASGNGPQAGRDGPTRWSRPLARAPEGRGRRCCMRSCRPVPRPRRHVQEVVAAGRRPPAHLGGKPNGFKWPASGCLVASRITTGLGGLDAQLGGGVLPGTMHVLISEPMNAQELVALHFAAGATQNRVACQYAATEATTDEVKQGLRKVGGDPGGVTVHGVDAEGGWRTPDIDPAQRYVMDSFSTVSTQLGWDTAFERLVDLRGQVRASKDAALISVTGGLHSDRELSRLKLLCDGVMELGFDRKGFGLYPFLKVTKMRGVPDSARFLLFKETEKGLFMESTRRVF